MSLLSLTQAEAAARSALLTVDRYDIEVDLTGLWEGSRFSAESTIAFRSAAEGADTFVDIAAEVVQATLNGVELDLDTARDGRLPLVGLATENVLTVRSFTDNTATGEGILRTVDPSDGLVYVWTSLEPDEARRLWACFDQPDLKAPHKFTVTAPASWLVTSNGAPDQVLDTDPVAGVAARVWHYPDTPALSTYVVVVNAGAFHEVRRQVAGHDLGFYCRQSLVPHLERDLEELITLTRQGLAFFGEQFAMPFPQERYDQVFVPNLGGAMENWGCITYGDSQLFRTPPSYAQRSVRAEFILHEMAHQWFGDLVTMRWWDDLWLNEAFASWAANWALARATEFTDQWTSFLAQYKRGAYEMDLGPGRHPIRGEVVDVSRAMANFDHITYIKGQSVLHQLMAWIGEPAFVQGLAHYFRDHAWGNTRLSDLMAAFGQASGQDLTAWTAAWLDRSGPDVLEFRDSLITVHSPDAGTPRPHRIQVASFANQGGSPVELARTPVALTGTQNAVDLPPADLHLVNAGDLTYAVVRPAPETLASMFGALPLLPNPLDRALVVMTGIQQLLEGRVPPREVAAAFTRAVPSESNAALIEPLLAQALSVGERWAPAPEQPALLAALADAATALAERPEHRQVALRTLASSAVTDAHFATLARAADGVVDLDLAWRVQIRRSELHGIDQEALAHLVEVDPDPDARTTKRLKVLAAAPDPEAKEEVWRAFFVDRTVPASRETLELGAIFWRVAQSDLLQSFALRYLTELTRMQGGLLNQGAIIRAMFPHGVGDETFLRTALEVAEGDTVSPYAANQLRAGCFTLSRMHAARSL